MKQFGLLAPTAVGLLLTVVGCDTVAVEPKQASTVACDGIVVPPLNGRVVDGAGLLDANDEADLNEQMVQYEDRTGHQAAILTLPTIGGRDERAVGTCIANLWELGDTERDDGIMIMVVPQDRVVRVSIGFGLEGGEGDAKAQIMIDSMLPHFQQSDHAAGLRTGIETMAEVFP